MGIYITILEQGLIYGILALGVYITYKILDFPDLTVDGSFPLGAALTATMITRGVHPILTLPASFLIGVLAGVCTGLIHVKFKVRDLLSGIIMMTALWTINLRLAGTANVPIFGDDSIFDNASVNGIFHDGLSNYKVLVIVLVIAVISKVLLDLYMKTKSGFLLRAVGDNDVLVTSLAKDQGNVKILGLAIANGLVALSGSIFCQEQRVFEISSGTGAIVIGLASVIIGTSLFKNVSFMKATTAVLIGSVIYKACVAAALKFFEPQDMKLITAVLFLVILVIGGEQAEEKETEKTTVYYVSDEIQQSQYINMFKEQGMDAVILKHNIDTAFITHVEQKHEDVKFQRIDADLTEDFKEDGTDLKEMTDELTATFKKALNNEQLDVKVEKLKNESISSMMTLSEESRRMQDMMKMYGMDANMFGGANGATLVLNANHPLVKYVAAHKEDDKNVPLICQQLYDLAMMAHKQLSPDEMTQFIARSNQILLALAK